MQPNAVTNEAIRRDISRVIITREQISGRVKSLAEQIAECYLSDQPSDRTEITILAVLTGSLVFLADLIRRLPMKIRIDVVSASSYPGPRTSAAELALQIPSDMDLKGKHVLVVDDILDSGQTLDAILAAVSQHGPLSLKSCVLLAKKFPERPEPARCDFVGFVIEPEFVVGYGLDYGDLYRNLPEICTLTPEAIAAGRARPAKGTRQ